MINAFKNRIKAAKKEIPSDLVLRNAQVVNVFSGTIQEKDVAVYDGVIVGIGRGYTGTKETELTGKTITPGLIDGHLHIESSMLTPSELAAALAVHGTTTIVADPHEIANVMGLDGIRFMLEDSASIPLDFFFMMPSCVPTTHLETAGATLNAADLAVLKDHPRILGLAEVMNFPAVLAGEDGVLEKISLFRDKILDGHCPSLTGHDLQAYLTAGIRSDHETTHLSEAFEKLENGMMLMIREGSTAKNLEALLPIITDRNARRLCFVSDDLHAEDIQHRGHLDGVLRKAFSLGLDPVTAIQLVTLNPAEYFALKDRGAVAPGYNADLVVLDNLEDFSVNSVYKNGILLKDSEKQIQFSEQHQASSVQTGPLNMQPLTTQDLSIPYPGGKGRIMEMVSGQIFTRLVIKEIKSDNGFVVSDVESDILKICVVERHEASGRVGKGLVRGFGLKRGAMASSVAHDSHNVIAVGVSDEEIIAAVEAIRLMGGGLAVVSEGDIPVRVPLGIGGLMSTHSMGPLVKQLKKIKQAALQLGCLAAEPFMALSFLALPVVPELKLTDRGLVDVNRFEIVPLFVDPE